MPVGVVGRKLGMTRVFTEAGDSVPVSVIEVEPNRITQVKTVESDGYRAVQVTTGVRRAVRVTKPMAGHFARAQVEAGRGTWEFRLNESEGEGLANGGEIRADVFSVGQHVDVTGVSKGKGFAGNVKRHGFRTQDATHGNSLSHRAPGSIGQNQTPGRVFPGKRMAGHMGLHFSPNFFDRLIRHQADVTLRLCLMGQHRFGAGAAVAAMQTIDGERRPE